jgi:hypothetical protein
VRQVADSLASRFPDVAHALVDAEDDLLAYTAFPERTDGGSDLPIRYRLTGQRVVTGRGSTETGDSGWILASSVEDGPMTVLSVVRSDGGCRA